MLPVFSSRFYFDWKSQEGVDRQANRMVVVPELST